MGVDPAARLEQDLAETGRAITARPGKFGMGGHA